MHLFGHERIGFQNLTERTCTGVAQAQHSRRTQRQRAYVLLRGLERLHLPRIQDRVQARMCDPGYRQLRCPVIWADSFIGWLQSYAEQLKAGIYEVTKTGEISRFPIAESLGGVATTNGVRIQANSLFIPERSVVAGNRSAQYCFAYKIRMSMSENMSTSDTCKLQSRHWLIKDAAGKVEEVKGPGVIGLYPVMKPGANFEYCSCSPQPTPSGSSMSGSFQMVLMRSGHTFDAEVATFPLSVVGVRLPEPQ